MADPIRRAEIATYYAGRDRSAALKGPRKTALNKHLEWAACCGDSLGPDPGALDQLTFDDLRPDNKSQIHDTTVVRNAKIVLHWLQNETNFAIATLEQRSDLLGVWIGNQRPLSTRDGTRPPREPRPVCSVKQWHVALGRCR